MFWNGTSNASSFQAFFGGFSLHAKNTTEMDLFLVGQIEQLGIHMRPDCIFLKNKNDSLRMALCVWAHK